jgi:hypothetical protein
MHTTKIIRAYRDYAKAHRSVIRYNDWICSLLFYEYKIATKFVRSGVLKQFPLRTTEFNSKISVYHKILWYLNTKAEIGKNLTAGMNFIKF